MQARPTERPQREERMGDRVCVRVAPNPAFRALKCALFAFVVHAPLVCVPPGHLLATHASRAVQLTPQCHDYGSRKRCWELPLAPSAQRSLCGLRWVSKHRPTNTSCPICPPLASPRRVSLLKQLTSQCLVSQSRHRHSAALYRSYLRTFWPPIRTPAFVANPSLPSLSAPSHPLLPKRHHSILWPPLARCHTATMIPSSQWRMRYRRQFY